MSVPAPIFTGDVSKDGKLHLDNPDVMKRLLKSLAGKRAVVTLKEWRPRRSLKQNAWWHAAIDGLIAQIADELGYDPQDHDSLHYELVKIWGGTHKDEVTGIEIANKRSSELTTEEFSDLMEWLARFAAEKWNVLLLLPGDLGDHKKGQSMIQEPA